MFTFQMHRSPPGGPWFPQRILQVLCCLMAVGGALLAGPATAQNRYAQLPPPLGEPETLPPPRENVPSEIVAMPTVQADLEVIHRRSQLIVTRSRVIQSAIADPSVIDVVQYSPNEVSVIGLAMGSTTLTLWFENNPQPLIYLVKVVRDPSLEDQARIDYGKLEKKIALLFPNSKVYLIPLSGKIIVKGQARDSEEASWILQIIRGEVINQVGSLGGDQPATPNATIPAAVNPLNMASSNIINLLNIPGEFQIMLRVRIVELNRSMLRRLGVDFTYLINSGRDVLTSSVGGLPANLSGIFENRQLSVLINALRSNGTAKILTEPTLTCLSGHPATVLSGGEFAVPTIVGINGVGGQQTNFRGFGTSIIVTPIVIDKDLIRMNIRPEFSEINPGNTSAGGIPGLSTRRVQTTVQLREGQTIVLAGLLSQRTNTEITGIPFLSGIPWIGPLLFAGKRSTEDETELLVTVTPELVRPMDPEEVPPYPGFDVTVPNDYMLYRKAFSEGPNDTSVNQLAPYGHNSGVAVPIGYGQFNPAPASPGYAPVPTAPYGGGFPPPVAGRYPNPPVSSPRYPPSYNGGFAPPGNGAGGGYPAGPGRPPSGYSPPAGGPTALKFNSGEGQSSRLVPQFLKGNQSHASTVEQAGYTNPQPPSQSSSRLWPKNWRGGNRPGN